MKTHPHWLDEDEIRDLGECQNHREESDPICQYNNLWYFWDECWAYCYGPFEKEADAILSLRDYAKTI